MLYWNVLWGITIMMRIKLHHKFDGNERRNPIDTAKDRSYEKLMSNNKPTDNCSYKDNILRLKLDSMSHKYVKL